MVALSVWFAGRAGLWRWALLLKVWAQLGAITGAAIRAMLK